MRILKLDLDRPTQLQLLKAYFLLQYIGCKVFTFTTRKGWHIYAILPHDIDIDKELDLRGMLGDDIGRIYFDEVKEKLGLISWEDTLFFEKFLVSTDGIRKMHEEIPGNPLYEPFHLQKCKLGVQKTPSV